MTITSYGRPNNKIIEKCRNPLSEGIIEQLRPDDTDYFLIKLKHSAFFGTALHTLLSQLGIKQLLLSGIAGNICVLFSANDAYMRELKLYIPRDAIASADERDNEYAPYDDGKCLKSTGSFH